MKPIYYSIILFSFLFTNINCHSYKIKTSVRTEIDVDGNFVNEAALEYDKDGNIIKRAIRYSKKDFSGKSFYTFDEKKRMVSDSSYNADNELIKVSFYEYNEFGDVIKNKRFFPLEDIYHEESYKQTYDGKGNLIVEKEYNKEGVLDWVYKYEFDSLGNGISLVTFYHDTIREEYEWVFHENLCSEEIFYDYNNEELRRSENTLYFYTYDIEGKKIKTTTHSVADYLDKKYIDVDLFFYDKRGNLIEEKRLGEGVLKSVLKTVYTYW